MLEVNSLTAIAKRTTPNTFRIMSIPFCPIIRSIREEVLSTRKITRTLITKAIMIISVLKSYYKDKKIVRITCPANS